MKVASVKMPSANADGITLGGSAWIQKNFTIGDPETWDGIFIDPDGSYIGAANIGFTVWENGKKRVQIFSGGINVVGGSSVWVPEDWDSTDEATWNGLMINNDGVQSFQTRNGMFDVDADGNLMPSETTAAMGTAKTKLIINNEGIAIYGGAGVWLPENYDPTDKTTWNGVVLNWAGMQSYQSGELKVLVNNAGISIFGGSSAWLPDNYNPYDPNTWDGVVINSDGLTAYTNGIIKAVMNQAGVALFGGSSVWLPDNYDPNNQATWNGVKIGSSAIEAYKNGVKTFEITNTGTVASYGGTLGLLPYNYDPNNPSSWDGIIINSAGLMACNNGTVCAEIDRDGDFIFGSTVGKRFMFSAATGVMTFESGITVSTTGTPTLSDVARGSGKADTALNATADYIRTISTSHISEAGSNPANGVIFDKDGLRGFGGSIKMFEIDISGNAVFSGKLAAATIDSGESVTINCGATPGKLIFSGAGDIQGSDSADTFFINSAVDGYGTFAIGTGGNRFMYVDFSPTAGMDVICEYGTVMFYAEGTYFICDSSGVKDSRLAGSGNRAVYSDSNGYLTNSSSDQALKTDVEVIPYGLLTVRELRPVKFGWLQPAIFGDQKEIGFIAQEVEAYVPEVVGMNYDGMKSLDYPKITAVLCAAIQELDARLEGHINGGL